MLYEDFILSNIEIKEKINEANQSYKQIAERLHEILDILTEMLDILKGNFDVSAKGFSLINDKINNQKRENRENSRRYVA